MASASSLSPYDVHNANLTSLCRICGGITSTDYNYVVSSFYEQLERVFSVDFRLDVDGVHPQKYCLKCYAIMNSCISRNGKTSVAPILWIPHSINCTTCELRAVKSKGGRPKKKVKGIGGGRPRKGEEKKVITVDDILKLDPSKPVPSSVVKALSYVLTIKMKQSDLPNNTVKLAHQGHNHSL